MNNLEFLIVLLTLIIIFLASIIVFIVSINMKSQKNIMTLRRNDNGYWCVYDGENFVRILRNCSKVYILILDKYLPCVVEKVNNEFYAFCIKLNLQIKLNEYLIVK